MQTIRLTVLNTALELPRKPTAVWRQMLVRVLRLIGLAELLILNQDVWHLPWSLKGPTMTEYLDLWLQTGRLVSWQHFGLSKLLLVSASSPSTVTHFNMLPMSMTGLFSLYRLP